MSVVRRGPELDAAMERLRVETEPGEAFPTTPTVPLPQGNYRVTLYGQAGSKLYEARFPSFQSFKYECPTEMRIFAFEVEWEEM